MYKKYFKRILDFTFALCIFPFFVIVLLIFGPIIYFQDKGPIFYNSFRLGKNGEIFKMYKFRSMRIHAFDLRNEDGSTYNNENDPRVTLVGKYIRKASIDEIPQILNVIKGDMSFIGPRPDLPEAQELYNDVERKKLKERPGLTGFNQAYYRNSVSQSEKFSNDVYYIENLSFFLDIKIFFVTLKNVITKKNINNNSSNN